MFAGVTSRLARVICANKYYLLTYRYSLTIHSVQDRTVN